MIRKAVLAVGVACLLPLLACSPPAAEEPGLETPPPSEAAEAADEIASEGGCSSNDDCEPDAFCQFPLGECGGTGTCEVRPQICTMDYRPVCGCDGETYSNACNAAASGVSIRAEGECA